jgi:N-acetylneuraminate synthase/sialic acid synthase
MRELIIAGRRIADDEPAYVVAELGGNHQGRLEHAWKLIKSAHQCGASAVKLQKRSNRTLYSDALLHQPYDNEHSFGATYGEHRAALELGEAEYRSLRQWSASLPITLFATAFDEPSADFLAALDVPAFKIHSGGLTDKPLLQHVASLGKPIILSTGGGTEWDIDNAVSWIYGKNTQLALMHCTAAYPLKPEEANLRAIGTLRQQYPDLVIGFSSHSPGIAFSLIAYAFGARIFEHHFTLNRAAKGTDHAFSLEPKGLETLVDDLDKLRVAIGDGVKVFYNSERRPIAKMRRTEQEDGTWKIAGR